MSGRGKHGGPLNFKCNSCRSWPPDVTLTGASRPRHSRSPRGPRASRYEREYTCRCGHTGWSCHIDLVRRLHLRS